MFSNPRLWVFRKIAPGEYQLFIEDSGYDDAPLWEGCDIEAGKEWADKHTQWLT